VFLTDKIAIERCRKSKMADQSVSVPITLSDLEKPDAKNRIFFQADLNNAG